MHNGVIAHAAGTGGGERLGAAHSPGDAACAVLLAPRCPSALNAPSAHREVVRPAQCVQYACCEACPGAFGCHLHACTGGGGGGSNIPIVMRHAYDAQRGCQADQCSCSMRCSCVDKAGVAAHTWVHVMPTCTRTCMRPPAQRVAAAMTHTQGTYHAPALHIHARCSNHGNAPGDVGLLTAIDVDAKGAQPGVTAEARTHHTALAAAPITTVLQNLCNLYHWSGGGVTAAAAAAEALGMRAARLLDPRRTMPAAALTRSACTHGFICLKLDNAMCCVMLRLCLLSRRVF